MNTIFTHALTILLGLVIGFIIASNLNCGRATVNLGGSTPEKQIVYRDADTIIRDQIVYRDRWHLERLPAVVRTVTIHDTALWRPDVAQYIARLDTITPHRDTLGISYLHPGGTFDLDYRPRPDSVRLIEVTNTEVVVIESGKKWGLGFSAGPSLQMSPDGKIRGGVSVGVGVNFNLWEP